MTTKMVAYCDGAAMKSGHGGWAVVYDIGDGKIRQCKNNAGGTTNNRMEMTALLMALRLGYLEESDVIEVYSDSEYAVKGFNEWVFGWANSGWKTGAGKLVKNVDLWKELQKERAMLNKDGRGVSVEWVPRASTRGNELADALAKGESESAAKANLKEECPLLDEPTSFTDVMPAA